MPTFCYLDSFDGVLDLEQSSLGRESVHTPIILSPRQKHTVPPTPSSSTTATRFHFNRSNQSLSRRYQTTVQSTPHELRELKQV